MNAATAMQWAALVITAVGFVVRVPAAVRGRSRAMTVCLLLLTVAMALSLPNFYEPVDAFLGGGNVANLLLRFCLYVIFLILGSRMAVAFDAPRAGRLVVGPIGRWVFGVVGALTVLTFVLSDLPETRTGLVGYDYQFSVELYATLGRLYPGYVAACVAAAATSTVARPGYPGLARVAAGLIALGLLKVVLFVLLRLTPMELGDLNFYLPFCAVIAVTLGLMVIQGVHWRQQRDRRNLLASINAARPQT